MSQAPSATKPLGPPTKERPMLFATCCNVLNDGTEAVPTQLLGKDINVSGAGLRFGEAWKEKKSEEDDTWIWKARLYQPEEGQDAYEAAEVAADDVFRELAKRVAPASEDPCSRNFCLSVHGFNVDAKDALESASTVQTKYDLEVMPFLWPSDGEGSRRAYLSDKLDADRSAPAFTSFLASAARHYRSYMVARSRSANEATPLPVGEGCTARLSLMCHSMGCYLLRQCVDSQSLESRSLGLFVGRVPLFDNIVLTAADVDSDEHLSWVGRLNPRHAVFICINTDDRALWASDNVSGLDQPERLGNTLNHAQPAEKRHYVEVDMKLFNNTGPFQHSYHTSNKMGGKIEQLFRTMLHDEWRDDTWKDDNLKRRSDGTFYLSAL